MIEAITPLRDHANGENCEVRIPGVCNRRQDTTVLAHLRMAGITGMSQKSFDWFGAHCCSACHDVVDGRVQLDDDHKELLPQSVREMFLDGIIRTQYKLLKNGTVKL